MIGMRMKGAARLPVAAAIACAVGAAAPALADEAVPQNDILNATLWMQRSVEYKAATTGIYALGKIRLDQALADKNWTALPDIAGANYQDKPPAIILDADETVLDNSPYEASLVTRNKDFSPKEWTQYVNDKVTRAIPGAVDFTQYAASKGVKVFYVSNRNEKEKPASVENMKALGFPMGGNVDTFLAVGQKPDWKSAKGTRYAYIAKDYRVLLLFGDNLGDFTDNYKGTAAEREKVFKDAKAHWGHDWIALPNAEYGSWESTPFGNNYKLSPDQRRKMKIDALQPWQPKE